MTKKAKFVLLIFIATVVNILLMTICFGILLLLYSFVIVPRIPEEAGFYGVPVLFIVSIILSNFLYRRFLKLYLKKHPYTG
jgi:hypothetical protein